MNETVKKHLQNFLGAVFIVGFTVLLLEVALRVLDPWGLNYFNDLGRMGNELFIPDPQQGYVLPDGEHTFSYWRATVRDGERVTPNNALASACQVGILGDSVAFGYGVNDDAVWLNEIARLYPTATFHNLGVPRYNSTNALKTLQTRSDYQAYVYLAINNDVDPAIDPATQYFAGSGEGLPYLLRYTNYLMFRGGGTDYVPPNEGNSATLPDNANTRRFLEEVSQIMDDPRVSLVSFANEAMTNSLLAQGYAVTTVNYPAQFRISVADYHLNPQGNLQLATQLAPLFASLLAQHCP